MFSKNYIVKGTHNVGKSELLRLRESVSKIFGDERKEITDGLFSSTRSFSEQIWRLSSGSKCSLFLFDGIPFFVEVKTFNKTTDDGEWVCDEKECIFFPTLFLLLLHRRNMDVGEHLREESVGTLLFCHSSTSSALISGANLMIPGIVDVSRVPGRLAFVFSTGMRVPYAIGYLSENFLKQHVSGVGAYILHCFEDSLWTAFVKQYTAHCNTHCYDALPAEFTRGKVLDGRNDDVFLTKQDIAPTEEEITKFSEEEKLMFCFVETIKEITPLMLPLKLSLFMALFLPHFPRQGDKPAPIEFKDTKYKKAVTFLTSLTYVTIEEPEKGVHIITSFPGRAKVIQEHDKRYKSFLEKEHNPKIFQERIAAEQNALMSDKVEYSQRIESILSLYKPHKTFNRALAYLLLLGREVDDSILFPALGEPACNTTLKELDAELDSAFLNLYTKEEIVFNVNKYIKEKSLFVVSNSSETKDLPLVKLEGPLQVLRSEDSSVKVTEVHNRCLKLFYIVYDITLATKVNFFPEGNLIPAQHITRELRVPFVSAKLEKKSNHKVTVVVNLEDFGFNLTLLCKKWKKKFATTCSIVDPNEAPASKKVMKRPREIHLLGKFISEIKKELRFELGIPSDFLSGC